MTQTKNKSNFPVRYWPPIVWVLMIVGEVFIGQILLPKWLTDFIDANRWAVLIITGLFMLIFQLIKFRSEDKDKLSELQSTIDIINDPVRDTSFSEIIENIWVEYAKGKGKTKHNVTLELYELALQGKIAVWGIPYVRNSILMKGSIHVSIPPRFFISCEFIDLPGLGLGVESKLILFNATRELGNDHLAVKEYLKPEVSEKQIRAIYEINS